MVKNSTDLQTYTLNTQLIKQEIEEGVTLFDPDSSTLFTLNETASFIFDLIVKQKPYEYIINQLVTEFQITKAVAEKDFNEIRTELQKNKILL